LIQLAAEFGIKDIGYFHTTDAWGSGASKVVQSATKINGINIIKKYAFERDTKQAILDAYINDAKIMGIKHIVITTPTPDTVRLFKSIDKHAMNLAGNTIYAAELILDNESLDAVNGSIGYFAPIARLVMSKNLQTYMNDFSVFSGENIDIESGNLIYSALSYDHIMLIAMTINLLKINDKEITRENINNYIRNVKFDGISGNISFSKGSNDRQNMPIQIMNSHGISDNGKMNFVKIAEINQNTGQLEVYKDKILWPGKTKNYP
jgi:ABC-type branched-subunit amino acid transport system substrate-binding protein